MASSDDASRPRPFVAPGAEEWIGRKIPCLDHGFIYLVDAMGGDPSIVQAARVSYGLGTKTVHEDRGLVRYLMRHDHTTPFEMVELKFHVKLPIFVARQWIRHRTACLSGQTRLFFDLPGGSGRGRRQRHNVSLEKFHDLWHAGFGRVSMRERLARMRLRMCDESTGEIRSTTVTDVWQSGVKPVFRVTLDNGYALTMTKDHRCLTERGWMTLDEAASPRRSATGGVSWNGSGPAFAVNGVPVYRDAEWLKTQCAETGRPLSDFWTARPVAARPATKRRPPIRRLIRSFARIARIEFVGDEMTYDLAVSGPYHNFVANGFIVHNSVNEYSGRYSVMPDEFYVPAAEDVTQQSAANRQGGGDAVPSTRAAEVLSLLETEQRVVREGYQRMLEWDIRRELARINLGVAQYTEWYWKNDLHNIFRFLELRLDDHAQHEIRVYAEAMATIVRAVVPVAWEAFEDYRLKAVQLTRLEVEAVGRLLANGGVPASLDDARLVDVLPDAWRERGPTGVLKRNRERDEFLAKLRRLLGG